MRFLNCLCAVCALLAIAPGLHAEDLERKADMPEGALFPFQAPVSIADRIYVVRERALFEYDSVRDAWRDRKAPLPLRRHHFAVAASGGKVYVFGGCTGDTEKDPHDPLSNVDEFDPATGTWRSRAGLPEPRRNASAVPIGGLIYIIGGSDLSLAPKPVLVYDPGRDKWTVRRAVSNVTGCWGAHELNNRIYAVGMKAEKDPSVLPFRTDEYDPATDTIVVKKPLPSPRTGHASAVINGNVYVFGGVAARRQPSKDVEAYDPSSDTWRRLPDLAVPRSWIGAIRFKEGIYLLGGAGQNWDKPEKSVEIYRAR